VPAVPAAARHPRSAKLAPVASVHACIDIGSNTTRLLVAGLDGDGLRELVAERAFTRIGASCQTDGHIPAETVAATAAVVAGQLHSALAAGAGEVVAVATAAVRDAPNRDELVGAVERDTGLALRVLSGQEEARLSFIGATRVLAEEIPDPVAVVDVGGGSTELAIGTPGGEPAFAASLAVGSSVLARAHLHTDPPAPAELHAARSAASEAFEGLAPPAAAGALAVGGTATSLHRIAGRDLDLASLQRALELLGSAPSSEVATRVKLDPERVRLLPGGILVLAAASGCLGLTPAIAHGGLREGVLLELLDRRASEGA